MREISEKVRTVIMASMLLDEIYEVVIQNIKEAETTYQEMKEKVSIVTNGIAREDFKVMEVGAMAAENEYEVGAAWATPGATGVERLRAHSGDVS